MSSWCVPQSLRMKNLGIWVAWVCWISWVFKPWSTNRLKWKLMGTYLCSSCHNFFPPPTKRPPVKTAAQRSLWLWLRVLGLCISESHPEVPSIIHLKSNFTSFHLLRNSPCFFFAFDPLRFAFELISYYHWLIVIYQSMTQKQRALGKKNLFKSRFHMFQNDWVAVFCQVTTVVSTPRHSVGGALFPLPNPQRVVHCVASAEVPPNPWRVIPKDSYRTPRIPIKMNMLGLTRIVDVWLWHNINLQHLYGFVQRISIRESITNSEKMNRHG